jgi:PAS domain S-box-containing protein
VSPERSNYDNQLASALDESVEELYEMAPCGYLTTAIDGRIAKINRTLTEWLGYEREELLGGKRFVDLLTVGGRMFYETHFNLLLRMQQSVDEIALDLVCNDGRVLPVLINARQKRSVDDEPLLNRFTVFNSSERRMYERDLLAARDLYQTTLASIGDGVVTTNATGRVTFLNPVAEELSGWKTEAAAGKPIEEVLILRHESTATTVENPITHALRDGVTVGLANHTVLISKDGREIPIDDSASPVRDSNGSVVGGVLVFRDITVQREAAKALRKAHEVLQASSAELRRSNEDLSQFAHVASHDLRSPLNTVIQFSQLLERQYSDTLNNGGGRELLTFVVDAAQRMRRLIDDLLTYAGVTGSVLSPPAPIDANIPIRTAIANLQSQVEESGATVTYDALPFIPVDETHLVQLFQNLIGNAIKYRADVAPRVHISSSEDSENWLFACADNGLGIQPAYHQQIFDAFKRLHGTERPGSGIGLAVCKRIVERFRGRIWVESQGAEHGSTFFFTFPKGA